MLSIFAKEVNIDLKAPESIWKLKAKRNPKPEVSIKANHQQQELCQALLQGVLGTTFKISPIFAQDLVADLKAPESIWKLKTKHDSKLVQDHQQQELCQAILRGVLEAGWESSDLSKLSKIFALPKPEEQDNAEPTNYEDEVLLQKQRQLCNSILRNVMEVADLSNLSPFAQSFEPQTKSDEKPKCILVLNERGLYVPVYLTESEINQDQSEGYYSGSEGGWQSGDEVYSMDEAQQWFPQEYNYPESDVESMSSEELIQPLYQNEGYYSSEESDGAVYYYSDNESLPSYGNEDQIFEYEETTQLTTYYQDDNECYYTSEESDGAVYYYYDSEEEQNFQYEEMIQSSEYYLDQNEGYYSCEESDEWQSCEEGYQYHNAASSDDQYWSDAQIYAWSSEFNAENFMC